MKRIRRLFDDPRAEVERELRAHIALRAEQLMREGSVTSDAALEQATREFDLTQVLRECTEIRVRRNRERRTRSMLNGLRNDFRYGWRALLRSPAYTLTSVLVLGVGFGCVVTVGSLTRAVLLRPLPFADGDALVRITERKHLTGESNRGLSAPLYDDIRATARSFSDLGVVHADAFTSRQGATMVRLRGAALSASAFTTLGVAPLKGRYITAEEASAAEAVALISESLWRDWYGGRDDVIGEVIELGPRSHRIIGVMPASFDFPNEDTRVWVGFRPDDWMQHRRVHVLHAIARLRPGVTAAAADAELREIYHRGQLREPGSDPDDEPYTTPVRQVLVGEGRAALRLLFAAAATVLLLAAANVSGLQIARGAARVGELSTRLALGAGRLAVMRQLLVESVLIGGLGGVVGLAIATLGTDALYQLGLVRVPGNDTVALDGAAVAVTFGLSVCTAVLFGLFPAWRATRSSDGGLAIAAGPRATDGIRRQRFRRVLVVSQTALALTLIYSASVLVGSFVRLQSQDLGFDAEDVLVMQITPSPERVENTSNVIAFYRDLPQTLESLRGVRSASATNALPLSGGDSRGELTIEGYAFAPGQAPSASYRRVLPNYFATIGMQLVAGREFEPGDGEREPRVVIIGETMARRHFGSAAAALDRRIKVGPQESEPWLTVVGVVNDARNERLEAADEYGTYEPHPQRPWRTMYLTIRTDTEPVALAPAVRSRLLQRDPAMLIEDVTTLSDRIRDSVASRRTTSQLVALLGSIAVLLAAIGIYGLIASSVTSRTRELAVRAALGANHGNLLRLVIMEGAWLCVTGAVIGTGGALAAGSALRALLFGTNGRELQSLLLATAVLLSAALVASWLPARRAAAVPPAAVLRA